jgi:uncharacterized protein YdhG (YjbR/CyaY superfamily)
MENSCWLTVWQRIIAPFYPGSGIDKLGDLKDYDTGKGTVRFPPNKPLPAALVRKLVKLRIAKIGT